MLHFSKLLTRGSRILESSVRQSVWGGSKVQASVSRRTDDSVLITLHNTSKYVERVIMKQLSGKDVILEPFSITSVLFYPDFI